MPIPLVQCGLTHLLTTSIDMTKTLIDVTLNRLYKDSYLVVLDDGVAWCPRPGRRSFGGRGTTIGGVTRAWS